MAGPFYNNIKGTTAGTPGTGAFTPNAASPGFEAWSTVPTGWMGLVRYEDGATWELRYGYWNGTTVSRSAAIVSSSSGSALTLSSSSTATMVIDASDLQPHLGGTSARYLVPIIDSTTVSAIGFLAPTVTGTAVAATLATTNFLTEQPRIQADSATTASAQSGFTVGTNAQCISTSISGRGGWEFTSRFGAAQLPTSPRLFCGLTSVTSIGAIEPAALTGSYAALSKNSTDTNLQFLCNTTGSQGTKIDTGISWTANGWYEVTIWTSPGSLTVFMLLMQLDTGSIYYGSTTTDTPGAGQTLYPQLIGGLSATTGTAIQMCMGSFMLRTGM